ncbi:MAG TPA: 4Fe-4S dicluster domain-containing protein [Desulfobacteraceae bacterium]|nr:4Fe-4S dicluster domain-containing protein [Desulfobacteraceae bacterium]
MMENARRKFLKVAGISALGLSLGTKSVLNVFASADESADRRGKKTAAEITENKKALKAKHWGMVIDTRRLRTVGDLKPLIDVCHKIHNVPKFENSLHEIKWIWEDEYKHVFPTMESEYLADSIKHIPFLLLCNQCQNPPCVRACPTKATFQREDGIVMMDFHRCIGCRFCMAACPYGSRSFNFVDPRTGLDESGIFNEFPTRMKGVVEKCNFCAERLDVGKMPACVEASNGAIAFGDLEDPESDVRKLLKENFTIRRKQELGTEPSVYYIV